MIVLILRMFLFHCHIDLDLLFVLTLSDFDILDIKVTDQIDIVDYDAKPITGPIELVALTEGLVLRARATSNRTKHERRAIDAGSPLVDWTVYFYTPARVLSKFFCVEGIEHKTDEQGYARCTVQSGFVVGEGVFHASLLPPSAKPRYDHEYSSLAITVTKRSYWMSYIQMGVVGFLIIVSFIISVILLIYLWRKDRGTPDMQEIATAIADGATGFLRVQYLTVAILSVPVAIILFIVFLFRPKSVSDANIPKWSVGLIMSISFLFGVACSGVSGFIGMLVAVRCNVRVAAAALRSYTECVDVAIRGGSFASFCFVNLSIFGVLSMFGIVFLAIPERLANPVQICSIIVGFSFGASFSALFAQLGGGIFTKAADIGADISGKVEKGIPEDDFRNPAVVADLVGDNVGDCAGRGADLFESISANCFGTMILGSSLAYNAFPQLEKIMSYILFPLLILAFGLVASSIGLLFVRVKNVTEENEPIGDYEDYEEELDDADELAFPDTETDEEDEGEEETDGEEEEEEELALDRVQLGDGPINTTIVAADASDDEYYQSAAPAPAPSVDGSKLFSGFSNPVFAISLGFGVTFIINVIFYVLICFWCFYDKEVPNAWWLYAICGCVGISISFSFVFITVYYTDYGWCPTKSIAKASETGAATNIITGVAVGMESTTSSTLLICVGILLSYYLGTLTGIVDINEKRIGGFYGIACATMGMLSTAGFILALDTFGPIADNAGGIVEMAGLAERYRRITDRLDAVGNTTKALTKGYAIGTAALAGCLLFFAFLDTVSNYIEEELSVINIASPEVFVGGLIGGALVYLFVSITLRAVSLAAQKVVTEVRRQFAENPGILEGTVKPDYARCVSYCTRYSLIYMIVPGLMGFVGPITVGFFFRLIGFIMKDPLMGVTVGTGFLIVATITAVLMGMFLNNSGGAWDNAKKYVETGKHGGKGSVAHEASIVGDTVGDPFKDTAGPSLHVLVKLLATVTLVLGPLWVDSSVVHKA